MTLTKRILLVEDDPLDVELTLAAMEADQVPYEVVVLRDGEEALDYLFARGDHAVLVLLDLKLPKRTGLEVLAAMKNDQALRAIPVVMLTSSGEERDVAESYRLGVNAYVVKPVDFRDYSAAIETVRTFWVTLNQPPPAAAVG